MTPEPESTHLSITPENHPCAICQKEVNVSLEARIVNAQYIAETSITFPTGKLQGQIWNYVFRDLPGIPWPEKYFNTLCYTCLERLAESGHAHLKPKSVCHLCHQVFWSEYNLISG